MDKRPVIGITPGFIRDRNKRALNQGYTNGVINTGGLAVMLPMCAEESVIDSLLETVSGILFSGGADIDARYFREENRKCGGEIIPERDSFELLLAEKALKRKMPVLGICRGLQLINTALGGTLHQDITASRLGFSEDRQSNSGAFPHETLKHWQEAPEWYPIHDVRITAGSRLHHIYGSETLGVNSFHHQAVKDTGSGLSVSARSSDGIIEAVEGTDGSFIVAVQWHPELMWQENRNHLKLFQALMEAAADY